MLYYQYAILQKFQEKKKRKKKASPQISSHYAKEINRHLCLSTENASRLFWLQYAEEHKSNTFMRQG